MTSLVQPQSLSAVQTAVAAAIFEAGLLEPGAVIKAAPGILSDSYLTRNPISNKGAALVGIGRIAGQPGVDFGVLAFPDALLGGFDGAHHRGVAAGVFVDTDAEVDLRVTRVFAVGLYKGEDLVSGLGLERLEHGVLRLEGN